MIDFLTFKKLYHFGIYLYFFKYFIVFSFLQNSILKMQNFPFNLYLKVFVFCIQFVLAPKFFFDFNTVFVCFCCQYCRFDKTTLLY